MLVHICCAVDSHYFLQKLQERYPEESLTGYFYDPNIHPYSEYQLRLLDVKRSCKKLGIELIEGEYDYEAWLEAVRGYENEPEKGARCDLCFDNRLESTAQKASELGMKKITTTLLTSPKKSIEQLKSAGDEIEKKYGVKFVAVDFRTKGGTQEQFAMAKEEQLYHQDYCGCIYALSKQRDMQDRLADELFSPITKQIQPESIEDRIELYKKREELEEKGVSYKIIREKFLNYRLLRGYISLNKNVVPSYILPYSTIKRKFLKTKIETKINNYFITRHENIYLITLDEFNKLSNKNYKNIQDIINHPLSFDEELKIRNKIIQNFYSLSPVIIIKNIEPNTKISLYIEAKTYQDTREHLVQLG
ncbi:MAG: diacylglucosamine hydrolase like protein [Sulfurospirillum sp.]|nr:MAG: diacylglucosamine hydrolase like protein [Sulfurospirillum sp.]